MRKLHKTVIAGLGVALGVAGGLVATPAHAVGPNCTVGLSVDGTVTADVQPEGRVTLTNCGTGQVKVEVRSGGTLQRTISLGSKGDGTHTTFLGVSSVGTYDARAYADTVASPSRAFSVVDSPTAATAGWKFVGEGTNVWGNFDVDAPIEVWTEVQKGSSWSRSQVGKTRADGFYALPLTYGSDTPGLYTFRVAGRYPSGSVVYSPEVSLERVAAAKASSAGIKIVGEGTNAWGTLDVYLPTQVWTEVKKGTSWSRSQVGTTRSDGFFALPLTYGSNTSGTYTFRVGAVMDGRTVYTNEVRLRRVNAPTASSASTKPIGQATNTWGRFDTNTAMSVWTEVWNGSRWSRSQTRTTTASGGYVIPLTYGTNTPGTYRFRVAGQYPEGVIRTQEFTLTRTR